jgi:hypothetical protein
MRRGQFDRLLFVSVRVISWIVLSAVSKANTIHEITRRDRNEIEKSHLY